MSAFVVEPTTINRVVTYLYNEQFRTSFHNLKELGYGESHDEWQRLARDMHALNVEAVNQRYDERDEPAADFRYTPQLGTALTTYKALQCWLYQCSEGTVPQHPLYQVFEHRVLANIAHEIISALPQYATAPWN